MVSQKKPKKTARQTTKQQTGGVNIGGGKVTVGGDIVGRDKTTYTNSGVSGMELAELVKQFAQIKQQIDARPQDANVDKSELKDTVEKIEQEVKKGEAANPNKVERWLRFLAGMADDIFQVTTATLANPISGVAKAVQLVAQKAKEEGQS